MPAADRESVEAVELTAVVRRGLAELADPGCFAVVGPVHAEPPDIWMATAGSAVPILP